MIQPIHIPPARVDDAAEIARVHVDTWRTTYPGIVPDEHLAKRRGIGRQLVATIVQHLRANGFPNLPIWVLAENPARAFYAALGGKPVRAKTISLGGKALREIGYGWEAE